MAKEAKVVMVIVVNEVHVTMTVHELEEKKSLLPGIRKVLVEAATTALTTGMFPALVALGVWFIQTLSEESGSRLCCWMV